MAVASHVCLIGLGEVGRVFAAQLASKGVKRITAYDLLFDLPGSAASRNAAETGVQVCGSAAEAVAGAELVVSAVTAAQALAAARSAAPAIGKGAWFWDLNSASPGAKGAAGKAIEAAGGRYVEAAVMSPIHPKGLASPMLLGGPHAQAFLDWASPLGLDAKVFSTELGKASAAKMCRSVMIKGVEALLAECFLTARHYGVEDAVLGSLSDLLPNPDWRRHARYMISRSLVHGKRRAEEMREVARTVDEAGLEPWMSRATAERQDWAWTLAQEMAPTVLDEQDLYRLLDAMWKAMAADVEETA
jgi:3-hydroxyisobutyrate dehydrogenase-like beta-hydroxyacid dehydrogenase